VDDDDVDVGADTATVRVDGLKMKDYHDFENAILGNGNPPTPSTVSYTVRWTATGDPHEPDNPVQRFRGRFRDADATMEWTATSGQFEYRSTESRNEAAQLGVESNGFFYR